MKLIDTHTHLYAEEFNEDRDMVIQRATDEGVTKFYLPAIDSTQTDALLALEKRYPEKIFAMAGLHPCSVKENFREELERVEDQLTRRSFAGIGETGLDFYWDTTYSQQQYDSLRVHARWAIQYRKPLILHTRNAMQETIDVVREYSEKGLYGIFHCFSGTLQNAKDITELDFLLGIGGVLTFKNSGLADVIREMDLRFIVLETDSPYLAPVPFRGKRNESGYLKYIARKLSEIKNIPVEEVAQITTENAERIFSERSS
jgi:TatD DNase family protein